MMVKAEGPARRASRSDAPDMQAVEQRVVQIMLDALEFTARDRSDAVLRQWQAGTAIRMDDAESMTRIMTMVMDLSVFTPSASGQTAADRLFRKGSPRDPADLAAFAVVRDAQPRILQIEVVQADGVVLARDLASADISRLWEPDMTVAAIGCHVFARFGVYPDGLARKLCPLFVLDADALAVATSFVRQGRGGLSNPQRCVEALYRHFARHGFVVVQGVNEMPGAPGSAAEENDDPLDEIAAVKASLSGGEEPPAELVQALRLLANVDGVITALDAAVDARRADGMRAAYDWAAWVMMDTMHRRSSVRRSMPGLQEIRAELALAVRGGDVPKAAKARFEQYARRLESPAPAGEGSELDKLIRRIRNLRARTTEQGCTEAEALAAAEKVAELLDRHGLSLSDVDYRRQSCDSIAVDTGRRRGTPLDDCVLTVAAFFDCHCWWEQGADKVRRFTLFGLAGDVQGAHYLYDMIAVMFETETRTFAVGDYYQGLRSNLRRRATASFQRGLAHGINDKLDVIKRRRDATLRTSSGRDLVPLKAGIVAEEMAKLGLKFTSRTSGASRMVLKDAFAAGAEAGQRFDYAPGLESDAA